jgi:hypothetical protein
MFACKWGAQATKVSLWQWVRDASEVKALWSPLITGAQEFPLMLMCIWEKILSSVSKEMFINTIHLLFVVHLEIFGLLFFPA